MARNAIFFPVLYANQLYNHCRCALDGRPVLRRSNRFTNTAVPRFDVCWQQHHQVFNTIAESNGWDDRTAALQLFAHLEGEALNVALLMLEDQRDSPEGLSKALSEYYNSPGRLAIFRRKFDDVSRRDGEDPASFATELEILAVRVSERSASRSGIGSSWDNETGLRRHLDSVPPDTPIREIVDRCRVWESHSDIYRLSPAPALGPEAVIQDSTDNSSCGRVYPIGPQTVWILVSFSPS